MKVMGCNKQKQVVTVTIGTGMQKKQLEEEEGGT